MNRDTVEMSGQLDVPEQRSAEQLERMIDAVLQKSPQKAGLAAARASGPSMFQ